MLKVDVAINKLKLVIEVEAFHLHAMPVWLLRLQGFFSLFRPPERSCKGVGALSADALTPSLVCLQGPQRNTIPLDLLTATWLSLRSFCLEWSLEIAACPSESISL